MTVVNKYLLIYNEEAERWDRIFQLFDLDGSRYRGPDWLSEKRGEEHIDWGTVRYEIDLEDYKRLCKPPFITNIKPGWDAPFIEHGQELDEIARTWDPNRRYAVEWEEGI